MAKKKRDGGGKKPRKRTGRRDKTPKGSPGPNFALPDPRAMERALNDLMRGMVPGGGGAGPVNRAQEIMYEAFQAADPCTVSPCVTRAMSEISTPRIR